MNQDLLDIVDKQLKEFKARGGDDLIAVYCEDEDVPEDSGIELIRRGDGRRHVVVVGDEINHYTVNAWEFRTEEIDGIQWTIRDAMQHGGRFPTRSGMGKFAQRLAILLDENKGKFEPVHEPGVALHPNSKVIIGILKGALPADGSYTIQCNATPDGEQDGFTFHDASGQKSDFWVRTGNGKAVTYVGYIDEETFWRKDDFAGLKEAVQAGLAHDLGMQP